MDKKVLIGESASGRLYLYWEEWKSNRFLHIRYWYRCKKDDTWKPGVKGIAIPEAKVTDLLGGFRTVLSQTDG